MYACAHIKFQTAWPQERKEEQTPPKITQPALFAALALRDLHGKIRVHQMILRTFCLY